VFIDAKVQGLKYKTATLTSYTNYRGEFRYKDGEDVEFFIGNISLGSVKAKSIITPCILAGDKDCKGTISKKALNIAMLLQNLDSDRADKNVLNLSRLKYINLGDINLGQTTSEMESAIATILATARYQDKIDSNRTLIDAQHAKEHMLKNVNKTADNDSGDSDDDSTDDSSTNDNSQRFIIDTKKGTVIDNKTSLMWQNHNLGHTTPSRAIGVCEKLKFAGFSDWRLPSSSESKVFHYEMNKSGHEPEQTISSCIAEVAGSGYVKTKKSSISLGGNPGDRRSFRGAANVRCVRDN
jgi:hypothetical protein